MRGIHHNLSSDQAYTLAHGDSTTAPLRCFFAGVIYDPVDAVAYRLSAPVEVPFGAERELIIPLPTRNDYLWVIELPHEPVDPEDVTVIAEGPITEDNLWEFCRPDEHPQLGSPATIPTSRFVQPTRRTPCFLRPILARRVMLLALPLRDSTR